MHLHRRGPMQGTLLLLLGGQQPPVDHNGDRSKKHFVPVLTDCA